MHDDNRSHSFVYFYYNSGWTAVTVGAGCVSQQSVVVVNYQRVICRIVGGKKSDIIVFLFDRVGNGGWEEPLTGQIYFTTDVLLLLYKTLCARDNQNISFD